jgi:hypothetical protein
MADTAGSGADAESYGVVADADANKNAVAE